MFELDILELLNKYRKANDEYNKTKILKSINSLIKENPEKFEKVKNSPDFDSETFSILKKAIDMQDEESEEKNEETQINNNSQSSDIQRVKKAYDNWLLEFKKNGYKPSAKSEMMVSELVNYYILNNFRVIEQILTIEEDETYEKFKNMVTNFTRLYFTNKLKDYRTSQKFKERSLFKRKMIERHILEIYKQMEKYNFNPKRVEEIINEA